MKDRPIPSDRRMYRRGMRLLSQYIPHFFTWIVSHSIVMTTLPFLVTALVAHTVNRLSAGADPTEAQLTLTVAVLSVSVLMLLEGFLRRKKEAGWDLLYHATDRLLTDKCLKMDQADADSPEIREQLERIDESIKALGVGLVQLPETVQNACCGCVGVLAALTVSAEAFTAVPLLWLPVWSAVLAAVVWGRERARRYRQTASKTIADIDRVYYAFLNTADDPTKAADMRLYRQDRVVEQYLQDAEQRFFEEQGLKHRQAHGKRAVVKAMSAAWPMLWIGFCTACLLVQAYSGALAVGSFIGCLGAWILLPREIGRIVWSVDSFRVNRPYMERLTAFLNRPPRLYQGSLTTEKRADRDYEIEFRHVTFRYPSRDTAALEDVSAVLRKGSRTAIVGENGSGKSTFIKLLCRLYDPDEGEILLNGIDIRKYRREEYAALISAVFQDAQLFEGSVAANVAGTERFDRERAARCLADAGAEDADTLTGEDAQTLSRSKAQRVAIARALYKDAPFLLLDEPTAAMDPFEEAALYAALDRLVSDRTAVFVSHRLMSCRFCDEILVMEGGRIVERGTHEALISQEGRYRALWNARAMYYNRD